MSLRTLSQRLWSLNINKLFQTAFISRTVSHRILPSRSLKWPKPLFFSHLAYSLHDLPWIPTLVLPMFVQLKRQTLWCEVPTNSGQQEGQEIRHNLQAKTPSIDLLNVLLRTVKALPPQLRQPEDVPIPAHTCCFIAGMSLTWSSSLSLCY